MDYETIQHLCKNEPSLLALRKDTLPLTISFLYDVFKRKHNIAISQDLFLERLAIFLEQVNSTHEVSHHNHAPTHYLDKWSREEDLLRIRNREEGYIVQLSPHAERLMGWFEDLQKRNILGTESRLQLIHTLLQELVSRSTNDIQTRLAQLLASRQEIDDEIAKIKQTGQVDSYSEAQIRERIENLTLFANQLLRDFTAVEERFQHIASDIQKAQLKPEIRRGEIVGSVLDADEQLETSDEVRSFRAFYELINDDNDNRSFDTLIDNLFALPTTSQLIKGNNTLRELTGYLREAGERVNKSRYRLAQHLRRTVDTQNLLENRQVQLLSQEIKHLVSTMTQDDNGEHLLTTRQFFFEIDGDPKIDLPMERPLHNPPLLSGETVRPQQTNEPFDLTALQHLFNAFYVDEATLRHNVRTALMSRTTVTLAELLNSYPTQKGITEIIAYLVIASEKPHIIEPHTTEAVTVSLFAQPPSSILMPRVIFNRI